MREYLSRHSDMARFYDDMENVILFRGFASSQICTAIHHDSW